MLTRPLLLGEAQPSGGRPLDGASGDRLAAYAGLGSRAQLLDLFDAANLLGRWPGPSGKGDAWNPALARRRAARRPLAGVVVLLGARVARAYRLDGLGWGQWLRTRRALVAVVPHPSGVNHLYNEQRFRDLAGKVLLEALDEAAIGALS